MCLKQYPIRLSDEEFATLKELFPARSISPFLRSIIQSMILGAPMPSRVSLETSDLILKTKAKIGVMKKEQERQEFVKEELFKFFSEKRIPVIYARYGKPKAKKLCLELIPAFRESGYLLPECFVKPLINDYLNWILSSGEVAAQYKEVIESIKQEGTA